MLVDKAIDPTNDAEEEMDSSDEALLDMLGLTSLQEVGQEKSDVSWDDKDSEFATKDHLPCPTDSQIETLVDRHDLGSKYREKAVCMFPPEFSVSAEHMRRLTDELVWGGPTVQTDRTYETITSIKAGEVVQRKTLTRLEHFVDGHPGWSDLCHNYLRRILSKALGVEMVLYKEKLNLKPPGGSGFAPHLDSPSLRIALGEKGPQHFCTVMVAIDDMTPGNGCLRMCKGPWTEENCVEVVAPEEDGNPDAGGRAGAIPLPVADELDFENLTCKGGTIAAFNGWAPHRSAANTTPFPRRAVFLTYNPKSEGDFHVRYYDKMEEKRRLWRESVGLAARQQREEDHKMEMDALATVPQA